MCQAMFQAQVINQQKQLDYDAMYDKYEDRFIDYLYDNFPIGNGTMLINRMEDTSNFEDFVDGLAEDELIYE